MYGLTVRFELRDDNSAKAFDALVAETLPQIKAREAGTVVYAVHEVEDEPLARVFYELYADRGAFEQHEREAHVRRFLSEREQHVRSFSVDFLHLVDSKGVPNGQR